jgi:hypothetical protein
LPEMVDLAVARPALEHMPVEHMLVTAAEMAALAAHLHLLTARLAVAVALVDTRETVAMGQALVALTQLLALAAVVVVVVQGLEALKQQDVAAELAYLELVQTEQRQPEPQRLAVAEGLAAEADLLVVEPLQLAVSMVVVVEVKEALVAQPPLALAAQAQ